MQAVPVSYSEVDEIAKVYAEHKQYKAVLQDLVRATNGANINPRLPLGAGMVAQIQECAARAKKFLEE